MTTQNTTTSTTPAVKPVAIVYEVQTHNKGHVTVTSDYGYSCDCCGYKLYGDCSHLDAVQSTRHAQGRK
jgi:hypothetical protein